MKGLFVLLFIISIVFVSGCSQDNEISKEAEESCAILGETFCNNTTVEVEGKFFDCVWLTNENRCSALVEK